MVTELGNGVTKKSNGAQQKVTESSNGVAPSKVKLPDKMKYHKNNGITPSYIKIILCPLPDYLQDIERERMRVDSMYDTD